MRRGTHARVALVRTSFGVFVVTAGVGWPVHAQVSVPGPVPVPEVELPPAPLPSVPAPPPVQVLPPPSVQVPEVPQVLPAPSGGGAGAAPSPGSGVGGVVGQTVDAVSGVTGSRGSGSSGAAGGSGATAASGLAGASGAGGALGASSGSAAASGPRADGGSRSARARAAARRREREGIHGTRFRRRAPLVRALRGCLDTLPRMQRRALVLHYGIGRVDARSRSAAARALRVSRARFGLIERRGVRTLVRKSRRSGCEDSGIVTVTGFVDALQQVADEWSGASPAEPGVGGADIELVSASPQGAGEVAGARESGDAPAGEPGGEDGSSRVGPSLNTPFGDVAAKPDSPFFVMLLVVGLGAAAVVARSFLRAIR